MSYLTILRLSFSVGVTGIQAFSKQVLNTYYVSDTVLGPIENKIQPLPFWSSYWTEYNSAQESTKQDTTVEVPISVHCCYSISSF